MNEILFDFGYLEEMSGGDFDFQREIVETYLEVSPELIEQLKSSLAARDQQASVRSAHTLKGSSRSAGSPGLGALCEQIEKASREGDLATAESLLPALCKAYAGFGAIAESYLGDKAA